MQCNYNSTCIDFSHIDTSYRRLRGDMIEVYKIIQGHYDPEASTIIKLMNDTVQRFSTRTNSRKVIYNRANTNIRQNSFSIRIANYWNKLPENIVNAPSINSFKNRLDKRRTVLRKPQS